MLRFILATLAASVLVVPLSASAQESDARAVVERAIQAQGGLANLTKADAGYRKVKGQYHNPTFHFTGESYSDAGNRLHVTLRGEGDNAEVRTLVMTGNKGWLRFDETLIELNDKQRAFMHKSSLQDKAAGLVALVRDKGYKLTLLGESTVEDRAAVVVKVQFDGMADMELFFDKKDGLLVKTRYRHTDMWTEKDTTQEVLYSQFELFDPAADAVKVLEAAKLDVKAQALLRFLEQRIPNSDERQKMALLVPELGRMSYSARQKASASLANFGPKAGAFLREAVKSEDQEVARRAEQLQEKIAQSGEPAWATAVVRLLAVRRPKGMAETLLAYYPWACEDTVAKEVLYALTTLVEVDAKAKTVVEAALGGADLKKREVASMVLGQDGGEFLKQPGRRIVIEGVRFARMVEIRRDGKLQFEMETFEHAFFNRLDDSLFIQP